MSTAMEELYGGPIRQAKRARTKKRGATAYFPGSGPAGKICKDCVFFAGKPRANGMVFHGKCGMYVALSDTNRVKDAQYIRASTAACKYFEGL